MNASLTTTPAPQRTVYADHQHRSATELFPCGGCNIHEVAFDVFFPGMQRSFDVSVHWTLAATFWRTHGQPRVSGVRWATGAKSFASWEVNRRTGHFSVLCGASNVVVLQELAYASAWCALDTGGCGRYKTDCRCAPPAALVEGGS